MVGDDVARFAEPEGRKLREHLPFVGNARSQHVIERRDPVGRDDQKDAGVVGKRVNIANLSLIVPGKAVQRCFENE